MRVCDNASPFNLYAFAHNLHTTLSDITS